MKRLESKQAIQSWLVTRIAEEFGLDPDAIDPNAAFDELGIASRDAVTLSGDLEDHLGRKLSPTLLWEYPSIAQLAEHLAGEQSEATPTPLSIADNSREPVAIVGIGLRVPGADSPGAFWSLLTKGVDAVREVPPDRWDAEAYFDSEPGKAGKMYTRSGGFLDKIDEFDADFFGISPREAARMDPQQRLLMETAWHALEDAGIAPDTLAGSPTGVFIGISSSDYANLQFADATMVDAYAGTGNAHSLAPNRISYFLDLRGPSIAVDTACSSSLVAVHQAVTSLRKGECTLALAGGVNVIISPEVNMVFSHARMMAPDGRCKTFDASADGYVRGEGCGVVVLKRLSDAVADGDTIYAVLRGSAVNHDGRSNGITAPNGLAQQDVIRRALADAGVKPSEVGYVEAHGTGTALGDPIEVEALKAVLLDGRGGNQPCLIGSVKTNIGHLEAAAGVAGLIKAALVLKHGLVPRTLHLTTVNPLIELDGTPLRIVREAEVWPPTAKRIAGVSSFGFGGANAHVVLEAAPSIETRMSAVDRPLDVLAISAKTDTTLRSLAANYAETAEHQAPEWKDLCFTANTGRAQLEQRLAVVARTAEEAATALREFAGGGTPKSVQYGHIRSGHELRIAFLFTGQGAQFPQMGRVLYETCPVFRNVLNQCDEVLRPRLEIPLLDAIYPADGASTPLDETAYTQPALFAIEYALAQVWRSWGVKPNIVMGHSVGEYVAACIAGVFSFEDGLKLIAERARLMGAMPPGGTMAAVLTDAETVAEALKDANGPVSIAALNGPSNTVISGARETVDALVSGFKARGIKSVPLTVSHAFHSPLMDPMLDEFERFARCVTFNAPTIPLVSNLSGQVPGSGHRFDAVYWRNHLRQAVRFLDGVKAMAAEGYTVFLEAGPQATLSGMGARCLSKDAATWLPSLAKGQDDWQVLLRSLQTLYVNGARIDWKGFDAPYARKRVPAPTYPFERKRYWLDIHRAAPKTRSSTSRHDVPTRANPLSPEQLSEWTYRLRWIESAKTGDAAIAAGKWIIFADRNGVGDALAARVRQTGGRAIVVRAGAVWDQRGQDEFVIDPLNGADFDRVWSLEGDGCARVVHLWSLDAPGLNETTLSALHHAHALGCGAALHLIQAISASDERAGRTMRHARRLIWCVTQGAQRVGGVDDAVAAAQAPLWGFCRTAALENAHLWGGLIDLEPHCGAAATAELADEIASPDHEDQIAYRNGKRYVARLSRGLTLKNGRSSLCCREDATYIVTGGTGGLGLQVARWLGERGAKHIVLFSRTPLPSRDAWDATTDPALRERIEVVREMESAGIDVSVESVDVTDEAQLHAFLNAHARSGLPPIRGVIHAAGVLDDHSVAQLSMDSLTAVMRPKVDGTLLLHRHLQSGGNGVAQPLDFFVMFSSVASVMGSPGQANYAAGNAFMDALAHYRRANGLPALCINWGPWSDVGMVARTDIASRLSTQGIHGIKPSDGIAALESLLDAPEPQVGVLQADWDRLGARVPAIANAPLFSELLNGHAKPAAEAAPRARAGATDAEAVEAYLRRQVAQILNRDEEAIAIDRNFGELGLDSIMLMELVNSIERDLSVRLFPKELFDRPTIADLAPYLVAEVAKDESRSETATPVRSGRSSLPKVRLKKIGPAKRNEPAVFLLSAPRSGSTLLRVMLAGHPKLFCPPELHLLACNSMGEWKEGLGATYLSEGLQRAVMELHGMDAEASRALVETWVKEDWPVDRVYRALQDAAAPRLLIDKSPSYGNDIDVLEHAERIFEGAKYIHLVRHPYSMIESFMRNRFEKIMGEADADPMALAEDIWTTMNANIADFLGQIESKRRYLIRYEDVVSNPEQEMQRLCAFLGVDYDPAVVKPYDGERMTDGVHETSMSIGDPNFLKHDAIDPSLGDVWKRTQLPRKLGGYARRVAKELEYPLPAEMPGSERAAIGISSKVEHVVAIQPNGDRPPFWCCAPAGGMTYMYFHLPKYLGENQPIYGLQDPALNPMIEPFATMEELCAEHVKAIRRIQPEGPYFIGGWSFGGAVAFETAQQLVAQGQQVAFLGIIDTEARVERHRARNWKERLKWFWGQMKMSVKVIGNWGPYARDFIYIILPSAIKKQKDSDNPSLWEYITFSWADAIRHTLLKRADMAQVVTRDSRVLLVKQPATRRTIRVLRANLRALLKYELKPYRGPITLLRAQDQSMMHKLHEDWSLGWSDVAEGELEVVEVPGNHAVLLSLPYIERVGEVLRDGIDKGIERYCPPTPADA